MKRLGVVLAAMLVVALVVPAVALAADPIALEPPAEGVLVVPAGAPLVIPAGWIAGSRGLTMQGPKITLFFFTITRHSATGDVTAVSMPASDSSKYWLKGVVRATPDLVGPDVLPFNPRIGAKPYLKAWEYPLPDGLPAGEYTFTGGFVQTRTAIDLLWYFDGQKSPMRLPAGTTDFPAWDFVVN